jgi:ATP-binding cassette subfamily B protein
MRRSLTAERQRELADLNVTIEEGLSIDGVRLARLMDTGDTLTRRFTASSERLTDLELRSELAGRWRMAFMTIVFAAVPAVIYLSAGLPWTAGVLSIGTLVAFTSLQAGIFRPGSMLLGIGVEVAASLALFHRIFEYQDTLIEVDEPSDQVHLPDPRGHLCLENVRFTYPSASTPAVDDVTLDVPAGTTLALVGQTGSGKSTLGSLVARLHDPESGRITIDGVDLRDLRLADLASVVGVVSQETYLLHASVRDNLRYARPEATDAEIDAAVRAAQMHGVIAALPQGYDTVVGPRGHRFSGGERQRLAIARTLLRNPRILVLDEATSALDTTTERAVQDAFDGLARGRTTLIIAHRFSTVQNADRIAVLDHGRVVESGTHTDLLDRDGRYAALAAA